MEKKNTLKRKIAAAGLIMLGGLSLTGCSRHKTDFDGAGNYFLVRGVVSDSESNGLVQIYDNRVNVLEADGEAKSWFPEKKGHEFLAHEFDFLQKYSRAPGNWLHCGKDVRVGTIYDLNGASIKPNQLHPGEVIEIEGRIRDSAYYQSTGKSGYCTTEQLAVYDSVRVLQDPVQN